MHTQGPWKYITDYAEFSGDGFIVEGGNGVHIIPDGDQPLGNEIDDFRLMVAAPEMLAALEEAKAALEDFASVLGRRLGGAPVKILAIEKINAAIKLARS